MTVQRCIRKLHGSINQSGSKHRQNKHRSTDKRREVCWIYAKDEVSKKGRVELVVLLGTLAVLLGTLAVLPGTLAVLLRTALKNTG